MDTCIEKLDKLIALKRIKGHKISRAESDGFSKAWSELVAEEKCFSERAEQYLYDGFVFAGAKPFVQWVLSSEDSAAALQVLFDGQVFGNDTSATFRVLVNTLAHLIISCPTEMSMIYSVIERIPLYSKNKEKKTIGDGHRILQKYFISVLDSTAQFPSISDSNAKIKNIEAFIELFRELIDKIDQKSLNVKDLETTIAIREWLNSMNGTTTEQSNSSDYSPTDGIDSRCILSAPSKTEKADVGVEADPIEQFSQIMRQAFVVADRVCNQVRGLEKRNSILQEKIDGLQYDMESLSRQIEASREREDTLNTQISERIVQISGLHQKVKELETVIQNDHRIIDAKNEEIKQRTLMIEALSRDRAKQSDEMLHRLASKLRVEYRDFKDAESLPMDKDLGENMREQLKNIFSILAKAGISLD